MSCQHLTVRPFTGTCVATARTARVIPRCSADSQSKVSKIRQAVAAGILAGALISAPFGSAIASFAGDVNELEELEQETEALISIVEKEAGAFEVKEIETELKDLESKVLALEAATEALGGEASPEIEKAAEPIKEELNQLSRLLSLFVKK